MSTEGSATRPRTSPVIRYLAPLLIGVLSLGALAYSVFCIYLLVTVGPSAEVFMVSKRNSGDIPVTTALMIGLAVTAISASSAIFMYRLLRKIAARSAAQSVQGISPNPTAPTR